MRILIASEVFYPYVSGVSVMAERLATQMAQRGHTVVVVTASRNRGFMKEERKGYTIYRLPSWPNPFRKGFRFSILPNRFIRHIVKQENPGVIHLHDPAPICRGVAMAAHRQDLPIIVTNHFTFEYVLTYLPFLKPIHPLVREVLRRMVIQFYNGCDLLTVPTQTIKEQLVSSELKVPIKVISNGVDISRFSIYYRPAQLRDRYKIKANLPTVVYVGRVDPEKNLSVLLQAFALASPKMPMQLVIVGNGNMVDDLKAEAGRLGIHKQVVWISHLDNGSTLMSQLYHSTQLFCIPSHIETESLVTMEAMASGLPIIAAKAGALPELVASGVNGYLMERDDPAEWAEAILKVLQDKELQESMSQASIKKIAERDLSKTLTLFEKEYEKYYKPGEGEA